MQKNKLDLEKRYKFRGKEMIEDCMAWAGYAKEEIEKELADFVPYFYDTINKKPISIEEYNELLEMRQKYRKP